MTCHLHVRQRGRPESAIVGLGGVKAPEARWGVCPATVRGSSAAHLPPLVLAHEVPAEPGRGLRRGGAGHSHSLALEGAHVPLEARCYTRRIRTLLALLGITNVSSSRAVAPHTGDIHIVGWLGPSWVQIASDRNPAYNKL